VPRLASLEQLERVVRQYAANQPRRWMIELAVEYTVDQGETQVHSLDYWPDEDVRLADLSEYHRDTLETMIGELLEIEGDVEIIDVIWRALPRPRAGERHSHAGAKTMTEKTGPSQYAKTAGLKSLEQIARMTGASTQTLINWHRSKPELFAVVVAGCVALSNQERSGEATRQG